MALGRTMGVKELNIVDDGSMPGRTGSLRYDDEGTRTGKTMLIENGVLAGHLHSRETAAKMGEKPTGNARAIARGHAPIVRMTNTYIDAGPLTRDELFAGVDDGIYCCGMIGGQTMMEMFTFSAAYGYRIHNGEIGELVRDIVLTGNVFETLHRMDGIADDLQMRESGGGCGKGGQSPLPVTFGGPHVRVRDVVVGGN
ncbi:MAG: TldD/PmbA family protein [Victivallales bacterium]|nr:TldD/PmbA family protein [Victivallales bacterium]